MIIWINGAFGSGKTTLALELKKRIKKSYIFDPEEAGGYIDSCMPQEVKKSDFQDYEMWRSINYSMLKYLDETYDGTIIVPMTIVNNKYNDEIIGRLRKDGVKIKHFVLMLSKEIITQRLRTREGIEDSWAEQQIDRCIDNLKNIKDAYFIDTDNMRVEEKADIILDNLNDDKDKSYTVTDATIEDEKIVLDKLVEYNLSQVELKQNIPFHNFNKVIKNEDGEVIAGIISYMYCWKCMYIDCLCVDKNYRKDGFGSKLLRNIEKAAKENGCYLIHLDTFDFQAKDFYVKHGYEVFGVLENCPQGHKRYYLKKQL